jgi:cytochrome c oxidase subunit 2
VDSARRHRAAEVVPGIIAALCGLVLPLVLLFVGCGGNQSALRPAGRAAEQVSDLSWWMFSGGLVVWLAFVSLTLFALRARETSRTPALAKSLILVGGALIPAVVLGVLLVSGLSLLPGLVAPAPAGSLRIEVSGQQWWWRVSYPSVDGAGTVALANEIGS